MRPALLPGLDPYVERDSFAIFSPCERYRYVLGWRALRGGRGTVLFILANPSTATAEKLDATLTRCVGYAQRWGYEWMHVVNVRAWRETNPKLVPADPEAIGPENDAHIIAQARKADLVIAGWGVLGGARGNAVLALLRGCHVPVHALRLTKDGWPGHPLYLPSHATPIRLP